MPLFAQFHSAGDKQYPNICNAIACDGIVLGAQRHFALVHLNDAAQQRAGGIGHGAAQLHEQEPCGLVTAKSELCLGLFGRNTVGMAGHDVNRLKPNQKRKLRAMHDRPRGDRSLLRTTRAFISIKPCFQLPTFAGLTFGTDKSLRPAHGKKIAGTRGVVRKPGVKRRSRHRFVCLPPAFHIGTNAEQDAPCQANLPKILQELAGCPPYLNQREEPSAGCYGRA